MNGRPTVMALLLFTTAACPVRAEWPAAAPRNVDQCRILYVCEIGTELRMDQGGGIAINREVRPYHDECRLRYASRAMPFPFRRLRAYAETDVYLSPYVDLQGIDTRGRPWFLDAHASGDPKENNLNVSWIDSGILHSRRFQGGYSRQWAGQTFESQWPWAGTDMLGDAAGTLSVLGPRCLYRLAAERPADGQPDEIPFPTPDNAEQAGDLFGGHGPYWGQQVYRFDGSTWIVRGFTSNCHTAGTFVVRFFDAKVSKLVAWLPHQYVGGLVHHAGDVYLLMEDRGEGHPPGPDPKAKPAAILGVRLGESPPQPVETVRRKIAELDSDSFAVREAASRFVAELSSAQMALLAEALATTPSLEQKMRLQRALQTISARRPAVNPARLEGVATARLIFLDRDGRQYVQPWDSDHPRAGLLVFDGKTCAALALPSPDFALDCQGDDGRLYGHDGHALYALMDGTQWRPLALLGDPPGRDVRVLAVWKGALCLGVKMRHEYRDQYLPVWLDPAATDPTALVPGKPIATGVAAESNEAKHYHVAVGAGDHLWFLRHSGGERVDAANPAIGGKVLTTICRASGDTIEELSRGLTTSDKASVWPLGPDTAIVAGTGGSDDLLFYDRGKVRAADSLSRLLEANHPRLRETMEDGAAFTTGDDWEETYLVRLGDGFYMHENFFLRTPTSAGTYSRCGIFREGRWIERREQQNLARDFEPIINWPIGVDVPTHRLLGFADGRKTLKWIPLASGAAPGEVVRQDSKTWSLYWPNRTSLPRFTAGWTLTPEAAEHLHKVEPQRIEEARRHGDAAPEYSPEYRSADMPAFRRWEGGKWRTVAHSLYGGEVFEDAAGGLWHFRVREAEVTFPDGRRQLVPLDAGDIAQYRLAVESADAVWVASQESLCRFSLQRDEQGQPVQWTAGRRFRLPRFGVGFCGPWIVGRSLYYVSAGKLFYASLAEL